MSYKFLDKKCKCSGAESISYQRLADELHKPIIRQEEISNTQSLFI